LVHSISIPAKRLCIPAQTWKRHTCTDDVDAADAEISNSKDEKKKYTQTKSKVKTGQLTQQ
jgi:hypothetical protein